MRRESPHRGAGGERRARLSARQPETREPVRRAAYARELGGEHVDSSRRWRRCAALDQLHAVRRAAPACVRSLWATAARCCALQRALARRQRLRQAGRRRRRPSARARKASSSSACQRARSSSQASVVGLAAPGSTPRCARAGPASCGQPAPQALSIARRGRHAARTRRRRGTPRASSPRRTKAAASSLLVAPVPAASLRSSGSEFRRSAPERLSAFRGRFRAAQARRARPPASRSPHTSGATYSGRWLRQCQSSRPARRRSNSPRWPASSVT